MHLETQAAAFGHLDLLGEFWPKSISEQRLPELETKIVKVMDSAENYTASMGAGRQQARDSAFSSVKTSAWSMLGLLSARETVGALDQTDDTDISP